MDDLILRNRLSMPVVSGTYANVRPSPAKTKTPAGTESFQDVLGKQLERSKEPVFSKHALGRAGARGVEMSSQNMERLMQGMQIAKQKGLDDTLILVDQTAYIVSVKSNTVITTLGDNLRGRAITNIEGTVIV